MSNMDIWDKVKQPPKDALKTIGGGRLKGMTDINPQWRLKVMTELFGPCGSGWRYEVIRTWSEAGVGEERAVFALIDLYYKTETGEWSSPVPGIGGNSLVQKESAGPRTNDEAYKMAITDALSTAMKALGVGADIYAGKWDGSKYNVPVDAGPKITIKNDVVQKVIESSLACITSNDAYGLKEVWDAFGADEKIVLWGKFNSQQRATMKEMLKEVQ